jgi:ribosomal subunit interface protein
MFRVMQTQGIDTMQIPVQITFRDMDHSEALEQRIRDGVAKLEHLHPQIVSCRVIVGESAKHQHQGREFSVHIDLRLPGHADIVATRHHGEDVYVALRDALDAAKRQLDAVDAARRGGAAR